MPSLFDFRENVWSYLSSLIHFCTLYTAHLKTLKASTFTYANACFCGLLRTLLTACSLFSSSAMAIKKHDVLWWCDFSLSWIWRNALTSILDILCCCSVCKLIRLLICWVNWLAQLTGTKSLCLSEVGTRCVCLPKFGNCTIGFYWMLSYTPFRKGSRCPHFVFWLFFSKLRSPSILLLVKWLRNCVLLQL